MYYETRCVFYIPSPEAWGYKTHNSFHDTSYIEFIWDPIFMHIQYHEIVYFIGLLAQVIPTTTMPPTDFPAFFASMSSHQHNVGVHHKMIFDSVQTNILNAYKNYSGIFQVPHAGTYVFSYSIRSMGGELCIELMRNAETLDALYTVSINTQDTSTKMYIGHFEENDSVFVRTYRDGSGLIGSDFCGRSSFAGYRIM